MESAGDEAPKEREWKFNNGEKIASMNSRFKVNMCFSNKTKSVVEALWLNFDGVEVSYGIIEPGSTLLVYTYLSHPWVFRSMGDDTIDLFVNGSPVAWPSHSQTFADVVEAPMIDWTPATHASDFRRRTPEFASQVRELLRAYHAQRRPTRRRSSVGGDRVNGKSRRSSTAGDETASPEKAPGCCGRSLWQWRGSDGGGAPTACGAGPCPAQPDAHQQEHDWLGHLPYEMLLEVIAKMAPPLRVQGIVAKDALELLPPGVQPQHGPVAHLAARLLGPRAPEPPAAEPAAWFAAAAIAMGGAPGEAPAVEGPLGAGAAAGAAGMGAFLAHMAAQAPGPNPQAQLPGEGAPAPGPQVEAVLQYTEAMAVANASLVHVDAMMHRQAEEALRLMAILAAQAAAIRQAPANAAAQVQPADGAEQEGEEDGPEQEEEEDVHSDEDEGLEMLDGEGIEEELQAAQLQDYAP